MPTADYVVSTDVMLLDDLKKHILKPTDKDSYRHLLINPTNSTARATQLVLSCICSVRHFQRPSLMKLQNARHAAEDIGPCLTLTTPQFTG